MPRQLNSNSKMFSNVLSVTIDPYLTKIFTSGRSLRLFLCNINKE
jgi:hypothetical protein